MFGNKKNGNDNKETSPPDARYSLSALTRGIHHAASSTHAMLAQQYMHLIEQFFDEQEDGTLRAKMGYVQLDDKHWIPMPLISLVAPRGLALDKMEVSLAVRIEEGLIKQATIDGDGSKSDRLSMKVSVSPRNTGQKKSRKDLTDIKLTFKAGDPPEGLSRVIDSYTNLIEPVPFEKSQPPLETYPPTKVQFSGNKSMEEDKG